MFIDYFKENWNIRLPGQVTWLHAVNSLEKLGKALSDSSIMIIESDITFSENSEIIAAHPPETKSDLMFEDLIRQVEKSKLGLKLDFKDPKVFDPCLDLLVKYKLSQPVILNADILTGNGGWISPFNASEFIATAKRLYPQGLLSLGWTTKPDPAFPYKDENIDEMVALVESLHEATFPVRASLLPNSREVLGRLLNKEGFTLSLYNSESMNDELLAWIKNNTDPAKTFYDFTDENKNPLRLW